MAKKELHSLLDEKGIEGKPLLVLNNKIDIEPHMTDVDIIKELNPLEWTKLMNNYKNTAEEIVLNEYVFI